VGIAENIDELRRAAAHLSLRRTLRPSGIGSLVFGGIAIAVGVPGMQVHPLNAVLVALGAFLVIEGVLVIASPSPGGIIIDGLAILMVGGWNIAISAMEAAGGGSPGFFMYFGIFQLIAGVKRLADFRHFTSLPAKPNERIMSSLNQMVKNVLKAKPKSDMSIVEFAAKEKTGQVFWRGKMLDDAAIFVRRAARQDIALAEKEEVNIIRQKGPTVRKKIPVSCQVGKDMMYGTMAPEHFARYESWKRKGTGSDNVTAAE
jgi:membrane-bound ClpP family serine protease